VLKADFERSCGVTFAEADDSGFVGEVLITLKGGSATFFMRVHTCDFALAKIVAMGITVYIHIEWRPMMVP
jgi:hypothetical protein